MKTSGSDRSLRNSNPNDGSERLRGDRCAEQKYSMMCSTGLFQTVALALLKRSKVKISSRSNDPCASQSKRSSGSRVGLGFEFFPTAKLGVSSFSIHRSAVVVVLLEKKKTRWPGPLETLTFAAIQYACTSGASRKLHQASQRHRRGF